MCVLGLGLLFRDGFGGCFSSLYVCVLQGFEGFLTSNPLELVEDLLFWLETDILT